MKVKIKEESWFARLAAWKLESKTMAAVLGNTIHLWNVSREDFLNSPSWVVHELVHVRQFRQYGFLGFGFLYILESVRNGYRNNRFEIEARKAEGDPKSFDTVEFI